MKFGKNDLGVYVEGASLYNPTEQSWHIVNFARNHGFNFDYDEWAAVVAEENEMSDDDYENLSYLLEDALYYLNDNCCEDGVVFTFRDTDFVLIGYNGLDNDPESMVD